MQQMHFKLSNIQYSVKTHSFLDNTLNAAVSPLLIQIISHFIYVQVFLRLWWAFTNRLSATFYYWLCDYFENN